MVTFFIAASLSEPVPSPGLSAPSGFAVFCWVGVPFGPWVGEMLEAGMGRVDWDWDWDWESFSVGAGAAEGGWGCGEMGVRLADFRLGGERRGVRSI